MFTKGKSPNQHANPHGVTTQVGGHHPTTARPHRLINKEAIHLLDVLLITRKHVRDCLCMRTRRPML
jgi:hypothetical protein